jgi:ABC-type enterobactin transport system permease subunit
MVMTDRLDRFDVGLWGGNLIFVILLETHLVSRPLVFFIGPLVTLPCIYLIAPSVPPKRWGRASIVTILISVAGYLMTKYVFK